MDANVRKCSRLSSTPQSGQVIFSLGLVWAMGFLSISLGGSIVRNVLAAPAQDLGHPDELIEKIPDPQGSGRGDVDSAEFQRSAARRRRRAERLGHRRLRSSTPGWCP